MKIQWELYFLRREKELQEWNKKRRKRQKRNMLVVGSVLLILLIASGVSVFRYQNSEYGKLESAIKKNDYRLAAVKMAQYVNGKYGEEICKGEDLSVSFWNSSNERPYIGLRAVFREDAGKQVYMIYLSKEQVVYLDTFQWEEISRDIEQEAVQTTGMDKVCSDTFAYSKLEMNKRYYFCPWVAAGAYQTKYEGDLEKFFAQEAAYREKLPNVEKLEGLRINGGIALYFEDMSVPTMRERVKNPEILYREQFETGLKEMEEKYHIDIASAVLFQRAYSEMEQVVEEKENYRVFPSSYMDYGEEQTFFQPAYTLLTMSHDKIFEPKAEEVAEGIYVFSVNENKRRDVCSYKETEPLPEIKTLAEKMLPDWGFDKTFLLQRDEKYNSIEYPVSYALAIDREILYPEGEVSLIAWGGTGWEVFQIEEKPYPPSLYRSETYHVEDGFWVLSDSDGHEGGNTYSILVK